MSEQGGSSNPPPTHSQPKAIASLAKKQSDVTRLGTHKLKFVPTLPARRKKDEVKAEEPAPASSSTERGRGRGRGDARGRGRGRGRGGGGDGPRPQTEMIASGPFAMGPTLAGTSARRTAPRSNFTPIVPQGPGASQRLGAGLTQTGVPSLGLQREPNDLGPSAQGKGKQPEEDDAEVYSDPDEGVEILDMENVRAMDWMAPETLKKEKQVMKKLKREEPGKVDIKGKGTARSDAMEIEEDEEESTKVNLANAVHLSDSEEEEEMEDIIDDFALAMNMDTDEDIRQERLYFFQFPNPLPTFLSKSSSATKQELTANSHAGDSAEKARAEDAKPADPAASSSTEARADAEATNKVDGVVGQLEVYKSGAVKMRLGNDIVLDVTAATQPSFLQHAVYVDSEHKRLCVLGEVNRRYVVSPDIDSLLASMERAEQRHTELDTDGLIQMDTT